MSIEAATTAGLERVLHGVLLIDEHLGLKPREPSPEDAVYDRKITVSSLETRPIGSLRLELEYAATADYSIGPLQGEPSVLCFRYFDFCEVHLERGTGLARIALHPEVNPGIAAMWFENSVIGTWLALDGNPVLHASCVAQKQSAFLIAGPSGSGKTTLAAACCAAGAELLSDDAVRLQRDGANWFAFPGSAELRLRKNAQRLLDAFSFDKRPLPDDRVGVSPTASHRMQPVKVIWLPSVQETASPRVVPLFGQAALSALLTAQRCDWTPRYAVPVLRWSRELAQGVSVCRLELPPGALADESLVRSLASTLLQQASA